MSTIKCQSVAMVALGLILLGVLQAADAPPKAEGGRTDLFGDPLPEGALARMGTVRWRHGGPVYFTGFSADGKQLVTASMDGSVRVWEVATGKLLSTLTKDADNVGAEPARVRRGNVRTRGMYPLTSPMSVVLAPDRKTVAAVVGDGSIRLWEIASGKEVGQIAKSDDGNTKAHGSNGLAYSVDGKTLAARGSDHIIRLFDTGTGKEIRKLGKADEQQSQVPYYGAIGNGLAFSSDGKMLAAINTTLQQDSRAVVTVWDVATGNELQRIQGGPSSLSGRLAFGSDLVAVSWADRTLRLYEAASGKEVRQLGERQDNVVINTLSFSPDGKMLATRAAGSSPSIRLWEVASGKMLREMGELPANIGENIYLSGTGSGNSCSTIGFSADGAMLAEALPTNTVRLWEVATGKQLPLVAGHQGGVSELGVSGSGKLITTSSPDRTVRWWDVRGQETRQIKLPEGAGSAVLSANGAVWAFGDGKNIVHIWDAAANKEVRSIQIAGQQPLFGADAGFLGSLALSPDGKFVAVKGDDQTIRRFEVATGKELAAINLRTAMVASGVALGGYPFNLTLNPLGYSTDGAILVSLEAPEQELLNRRRVQDAFYVCLWDSHSGKLLRSFEFAISMVAALAVSQDNQYLLAADGNDAVTVWEVASAQPCFKVKLKREPAAKADPAAEAQGQLPIPYVSALAVAPDGRTAAIAALDRQVRLVDLRTGKETARLKGHQGAVLSMAYTADSQTLISGSADSTALIWDLGRLQVPMGPAVKPTDAQLDALWTELAAEPSKAFQALATLSAAPKEAVALFGDRLKPAAGADAKAIDKLIADLENDKFEIRQKASEELEKLGELAEPALQKVLDGKPALETRQRIDRILESRRFPQPPATEVLRTLRAVRVLAEIGTPEARKTLQALADGVPGAALTREAQAALTRLKGRPAGVP